MKAPENIAHAVTATLNQFSQAYSSRDISLLRGTFAPDPDVLVYGTGADEKRIGISAIEQQARRDWSQSDEASFAYEWMSVSSAGTVAWAACDVAFRVKTSGQTMSFPGRMTAVLEARADRWIIVQVHFSFPSAAQAEGESFPT